MLDETIPDMETSRSFLDVLVFHIGEGVRHIIPLGLDHILFVIALAIAAASVRGLILQVSAFTVAHSVTLGLAAAGLVNLPAQPVEVLIALSIAVLAIENLFVKGARPQRVAVIFLFGLVHGLGFASVFSDLSIAPNVFWPSLIGFNIGVEAGQLVVIAAVLAVGLPARFVLQRANRDTLYQRVIVWPVSIAIAAIGLWWAVERAFLG